MKPTLETRSKWHRVSALGLRAAVILTLFFGLATARADTTGFMDVFAPSNWSPIVGSGSVYFTNSDTELVLAGPNQPATAIPQSFDGILYNGPLAGGLVVGGTMSFHWEYSSGDTLSDSGGQIGWTPPGGTSTQSPLGQGGPGIDVSGDFPPTLLSQGTTNLTFVLVTDTLANKLGGTLIITDFQFREVPEPSTGALVAVMLVSLGAVRWRHCPRQASKRQ